jgi:hypothetical protein
MEDTIVWNWELAFGRRAFSPIGISVAIPAIPGGRPDFEELKALGLPVKWPVSLGQMKPFNDLTGREFGFLIVVAHSGTHEHRRYWKVHCRLCGGSKVVAAQNLLCGRSKSCGCVARAKARERMQFAGK